MQVLLRQLLQTAPELCPDFSSFGEDALLELVREGGFYHDIGKIMVPQEILKKHGKLTPAERAEIKKHPIYTQTLLEPFLDTAHPQDRAFLKTVIEIGKAHHERWDGAGYPYGLKGADIPFYARLCAVADAYDAMLSRRAYSPSFSDTHAVREIESCAGTQFDPAIVEVFSACRGNLQNINERRNNSK